MWNDEVYRVVLYTGTEDAVYRVYRVGGYREGGCCIQGGRMPKTGWEAGVYRLERLAYLESSGTTTLVEYR